MAIISIFSILNQCLHVTNGFFSQKFVEPLILGWASLFGKKNYFGSSQTSKIEFLRKSLFINKDLRNNNWPKFWLSSVSRFILPDF